MASSVFYKFASQKTESRVTFDGTGISVFDLKKEIILANNLGKANDFDLFVYDTTNQEYKDDSQTIPRSSAVVVKRRPAVRPGKGKAAMYIAGAVGATSASTSDKPGTTVNPTNNSWYRPGLATGTLSKRFDAKEKDKEREDTSQKLSQTIAKPPGASDDEAAAMAAMFQAQTANWEETQEKMSQLVPRNRGAVRIYNNPRGTGFNRGGKPPQHQQQHQQQPDRPLPPSYVCYRCGQKGHWIQDCPTNNDREFDNKPRIKRTTGIPRSFLKSVDNPSGQLSHGVMVTPEGGYVVAQPDSAAWQKQVSRPKTLTEADVRERTPTDPSLVCPIDNRLFRDAVKTPCCETTYCEECIQTNLLERDFLCPNCGKKVASLDKLVLNKPMRTRVADYIDKAIEQSKKEENSEEVLTNVASSSANGAQDVAVQDEQSATEQEYYADQSEEMDVARMLVDSIPQLQAQIAQISRMLQNPSLPNHVRQTTELQYGHLQMQLQQAQTMAAALTAAATTLQQQQQQSQQIQQQQQQQQQQMALAAVANGIGMPPFNMNPNMNMAIGGMGGFPQAGVWTNPFPNQQPAGKDSAYQRLPLNNRRRNLKRERPSDFLEVAGADREGKVPRFWE